VRLSIGGQPWSELELHGRPWGARRSGRGGEGERSRGTASCVGGGGAMGGSYIGEVAGLLLLAGLLCSRKLLREEERRKERRKRKGRKRKEKKEKMEKFPNLKFFEK
jgi:hypothetical protein